MERWGVLLQYIVHVPCKCNHDNKLMQPQQQAATTSNDNKQRQQATRQQATTNLVFLHWYDSSSCCCMFVLSSSCCCMFVLSCDLLCVLRLVVCTVSLSIWLYVSDDVNTPHQFRSRFQVTNPPIVQFSFSELPHKTIKLNFEVFNL